MCCVNNRREKWVISLVLVGVFFSLGVAVPMILISFPGNECLLFVSVRGEALIYGHPAGCNFISAAHSLVAGAALVFFIVLVACRRGAGPGAGANKNPSNGSVRSLRGSMATVTSSFGPRAKPTITLIVFSTIMFLFVLITAVVILSGYVVTCGELQYETRRNLYSSLPLGAQVNSVSHWCWSLFRDTDYHTRFHFDHYELSGQWLGQYTANRHGRPKTWTGSHEHLLDIATGMEMCLGCSWLGAILWAAITTVLILHRRSVKSRARADEGESLEDARIWATDMSPGAGGGGHYEKINMQSVAGSQQYESIRNMQTQSAEYPPPPSDASDVDTLLAHQNVIASSHPDGSYFMTQEGQYVQLINGVLTHVDITPSPPVSVTYSQPQFQNPQGAAGINGVLNAAYPGYPSFNPSNPQSMPVTASGYPQPQQQLATGYHQASQNIPQQPQAVYNQFQQQAQHASNLQQAVSLPTAVQGPSRPLMASSPMGSSQSEGEVGGQRPIRGQDDATRMNMRRQMDVATAAGIKCSQF